MSWIALNLFACVRRLFSYIQTNRVEASVAHYVVRDPTKLTAALVGSLGGATAITRHTEAVIDLVQAGESSCPVGVRTSMVVALRVVLQIQTALLATTAVNRCSNKTCRALRRYSVDYCSSVSGASQSTAVLFYLSSLHTRARRPEITLLAPFDSASPPLYSARGSCKRNVHTDYTPTTCYLHTEITARRTTTRRKTRRRARRRTSTGVPTAPLITINACRHAPREQKEASSAGTTSYRSPGHASLCVLS